MFTKNNTSLKEVIVYDIETMPNYFLIVAKPWNGGQTRTLERFGGDSHVSWADIEALFEGATALAGFNNLAFDDLLLRAIKARGALSVGAIKNHSNAIIAGNHSSPWKAARSVADALGLSGNLPELPWASIDAKPHYPMEGLKLAGAKAGANKLQHMPVDHNLNAHESQLQIIREYCANDVDVTRFLLERVSGRIEARLGLAEKFGQPSTSFINKSDAQVAEGLLLAVYSQRFGRFHAKQPEFPKEFKILEALDSRLLAIAEKRQAMSPALEAIASSEAKWDGDRYRSDEIIIDLRGIQYKLGVGGLHSVDGPGIFKAGEGELILDCDLASCYPHTIIEQKALETNLLGVFSDLLGMRLEAKRQAKAGDKKAEVLADGLKIALNSIFGKLGNRYSALFDPMALCRVTITNQVRLLILADMLGEAGHQVISANTDGVVCHSARPDDAKEVAREWAKLCSVGDIQHQVEFTEYSKLIRRDVNNYLAVGVDGKLKRKGVFSDSNKYDVVALAVSRYFAEGVPVEKTIKSEKDPQSFVWIRRSAGGFRLGNQDIGATARVYMSKSSSENLLTGEKRALVDKELGRAVVQVTDLGTFDRGDVDEARYIAMAYELIEKVEAKQKEKKPSTTRKVKKSKASIAGDMVNIEDSCSKIGDTASIPDVLDNLGIPWRRVSGPEIEADIKGIGHYSYKINANTGVYCGSEGNGSVLDLERLLSERCGHDISVDVSSSATGWSPDEEQAEREKKSRKGYELWKKSMKASEAPIWMLVALAIYLEGRGFKKSDWARLLRGRQAVIRFIYLNKEEHGADFAVVFSLRPMGFDNLDEVGGVQLLALNRDGTKGNFNHVPGNCRKIYGRLKDHFIYIPQQQKIKNVLGDGLATKVAFVAEGFETALSINASTGHACFAALAAGNLPGVAMQVADIGLVPAIAADRDKSMTGQTWAKKAIQEVRDEGYQALYCIPPIYVAGGDKGADWNDCLKELKNTMTAIEVAKAVGRGDLDMETSAAGDHSRSWVKLSQKSGAVIDGPELNTLDDARERVAKLFHMESMAEMHARSEAGIKEKNKHKKGLLVLVEAETGLGKSRAAAQLLKDPGELPILLASQTRAMLEGYRGNAWELFGRSDPENDKSGGIARCPKYNRVVEVSEKNQMAMGSYCIKCIHGLKNSLLSGKNDDRTIEKAQDCGYSLNELLDAEGCDFLSHVDNMERRKKILSVGTSYVPAIGEYKKGEGDDKETISRPVYHDETPPLHKSVRTTVDDIIMWRKANEEHTQRTRRALEMSRGGEVDDLKKQLQDQLRLDEAFTTLATEMASVKGLVRIASSTNIARAMGVIADVADGLSVADWEKVQTHHGELKRTPQRAANSFLWSLVCGAGFVENGALTTFDLEAFGARCLGLEKHNSLTFILDATPPPELEAIADEVVNLKVGHRTRITRYGSRLYGPSTYSVEYGRKDHIRFEKEKRRHERAIKRILERDPQAVFLFHKEAWELFKHLIPEGNSGYFGMDHRAHNRWAGRKTLILFGNFYIPPHKMLEEWEKARAFAITGGANPEEWPEWDGGLETGFWVSEGSHEVRCWLPLPDNEKVRDYFLVKARNEVIQAIGRLRPINYSHQVEILAYGGLPLLGIENLGYAVQYGEDEIGMSRGQWNGSVHIASEAKIVASAAMMIDEGTPPEKITYRALNNRMKSATGIASIFSDASSKDSNKDLEDYIESAIASKGASPKNCLAVLGLVKSIFKVLDGTIRLFDVTESGKKLTEAGRNLLDAMINPIIYIYKELCPSCLKDSSYYPSCMDIRNE